MILLARPRPHLPRTLEALKQAGFASSSILSFSLAEPESQPITLPEDTTALIFTSILALENPPSIPLPAFCVGETTAEFAQSKGFPIALVGKSDGPSLARGIQSQNLSLQHFVHLHGDKANRDWHTLLEDAGHKVTSQLAYTTNHVQAVPQTLVAPLQEAAENLLPLLFSVASTHHLAKLLKHANIPLSGTALCLSPAVAQAAATYWPQTRTASHPTLEGMLTLLHNETDPTRT